MTTSSCNIYPLVSHVNIAKLGVAGVYLFECRNKVTEKKTRKKYQILGKKSQEKKSHACFFYLILEMNIIIFIITNIFKNSLFGLMLYILIINFMLCRSGANAS